MSCWRSSRCAKSSATGRSFQQVVDDASVSAYRAGLKIPWGADGDHLKTKPSLKEAVSAGCTHLTFDVSDELKQGMKAVTDECRALRADAGAQGKQGLHHRSVPGRDRDDDQGGRRPGALRGCKAKRCRHRRGIAPRFPGYFEKAIDYYSGMESGTKHCDTRELEDYLQDLSRLTETAGIRVSIHSGSDKFSIYPIAARTLKSRVRVKTAGTYYLEELKIVARHDLELFGRFSSLHSRSSRTSRATYELSARDREHPRSRRVWRGEDGEVVAVGVR